ncbi:MAG: hypothetical protein AAGA46_00940 [Cyanobacteria bacterium P01_F01_bin.13]
MLKHISTLPTAKQHKLRNYLNRHRFLLESDTSSYGIGRQRYWLEHQPILGSCGKQYLPAVQQSQFWHFCKAIYQRASRIALPGQQVLTPDLGLVAYGGVGIRQHRDDPYASCPAVTINLSTMTTQWGYTATYSGYEKRRPKRVSEEIYQLPPGAVIMFNSQNPHRVISPDRERWSINLWRISSSCRPHFQSYLDVCSPAANNAVSFFPQVEEKSYGQDRNQGFANWEPDMGISRTRAR